MVALVDVARGAEIDAGARRVPVRAGLIERPRLLAELRAAADVPALLVLGSAGYGKTTSVSQWLGDDPRPTAWLTLSRQHDDPAVLLADVVRVLDESEPLPPAVKRQLVATAIDFSSVLVPRLEHMMARRARPFVLVLDDAHHLHRRAPWALVQALADGIPAGSQLVLLSRREPELALGRMRSDRRVHTLSTGALALDRDEAGALLRATGIPLPSMVVEQLWERTEGWPVGLYFATLALADTDDPVATAAEFAGDDRIVVDYVREEMLGVLPRRVRDFLLQASIIDELRAPVCNEVLARDDSAKLLAEAAASLQLLIPLDRRGDGFRMHQLLRDTLRAELARREPELAVQLHTRAAEWYESAGDLDRAVEHLRLADERDQLDRVIWRGAPVYGGVGRTATVERWLKGFTLDELRSRPGLAASRAWVALMAGDMSSLRYWADAVDVLSGDGELPDGNPAAQQASLLRASLGAHGIEEMRADAARAYELDRTGSPFRAIARYIEGSALRLQSRRVEAHDRLVEGEAIGAVVLPATQAHCLAQLAALAIDDDDWETAHQHVVRLVGLLDRYDLRERPVQSLSMAVAALVLARDGDSTPARAEAKQSLFLVSMLSTVAPWVSIETRIMLARAFLLLGDVALARTLIREAIEMLVLVPDDASLRACLAALEQSAAAEDVPAGMLANPVTPAEMRVLRYLPTHLTFAAIADELFVSRNTVKTQVVSIYRKLGVSSRGPAVDAARGLGLLED